MSLAQQFYDLFLGQTRAYGTYELSTDKKGNKVVGKALTIRETLTPEVWEGHLAGKQGIGIAPIDDQSNCTWAALDIDNYDGLEHRTIAKRLADEKLPLFVCRSKSGGAHVFIFFKQALAGAIVRAKLSEIAAHLGVGGCEIFPKQGTVLAERGDLGSWINMPYFAGASTTRYCVSATGESLSPESFVALAERSRVSEDFFSALKLAPEETALPDGPPCLQAITKKGVGPGFKHDVLFNYAIYARKYDPENWKIMVEEYNAKHCTPPWTAPELHKYIEGWEKKEYHYMCQCPALKAHCNRVACKTRKHGVGMTSGVPIFASLTRYCSEPAIFFAEVEGYGKVYLSSDDLNTLNRFQAACIGQLKFCPPQLKRDTWVDIVNDALKKCQDIPVPDEARGEGMLLQEFEDFISLHPGERKEDVTRGLPFFFNQRHWFVFNDFMEHLEQKKLKVPRNRVMLALNQWGAQHEQWTLPPSNKRIRVWGVPGIANETGALSLPDIPANEY